MKCPSCNRETNDNGKFCTFCGARLPAIKYCPKCSASLSQNKKFCEKCGAPNPYFASNSDLTSSSLNNNVSYQSKSTIENNSNPGKGQSTYPVYCQTVNANIAGQEQLNHQEKKTTSAHGCAPTQTGYQNSSISDSEAHVEYSVNTKDLTENAMVTTTSDGSGPTFEEETNDKRRTSDNPSSCDDQIPTSNNPGDVELPVYEEPEHKGSSYLLVTIIIALILIAGGVLLSGQRLNWWNIEMLNWVNCENTEKENIEFAEDFNEAIGIEEVEDEEAYTEPEKSTSVPISITLNGKVGNKYPIEMVLDGEKKGNNFYPSNGKYRYTKYEGAWINLHCEILEIVNSKTYLKMLEYTDGNLTGSWQVKFDSSDNTLTGDMTNSKEDTYSISLKSGSEFNSGYNKIEGAVVADSNIYPFYIDFFVENGSIKNASYHNPKYDVKTELTKINISEDEYCFEGDLNGKALIIRFSKNNPHKGTLYDGSNTLDIEMNI